MTEKKEELDRLENYVIAMGVRGWKWWKETWERTYRGGKDINLDQLNAFKEEILCVLEPFRDCMKAEERTIGSMTDGVIRCLETCMVREKLDQYCQYLREPDSSVLPRNMSRSMTGCRSSGAVEGASWNRKGHSERDMQRFWMPDLRKSRWE